MKRAKRKGRQGKAASPYAKYNKRPVQYSTEYYTWRRKVMLKDARATGPIAKREGRLNLATIRV